MALFKKPESLPISVDILIAEALQSLNARPFGEVDVINCQRATVKSSLATAILLKEIVDMMRSGRQLPE